MKKLSFLAPIALIISACSSKPEELIFVPPVIDAFEIMANGDVKLTGSGMESLEEVDEQYNFSVSMHNSLGESSFIAFGAKPEIKDDKTLIFKPSQFSKAQIFVKNNKTISDSLKAVITPEWNGKSETFDVPKAKYAAVIGQLATGDNNCTLWIDMKDTGKVFFDPSDKSETFTIFGHYELYSHQKGNNSSYNRKKLNYVSRESLN